MAASRALVTLAVGLVALVAAGCSSGTPTAKSTGSSTTQRHATTTTSSTTSTSTPVPTTTTTASPPPTTAATTTTTTQPTTTTTAGSGASPLAVGHYLDGPTSTPRYDFDITSVNGNQIAGQLSFIYQDGRTSGIFSFQGTVAPGQAFPLVTTPVMSVSATAVQGSVVLQNCTAYLQFASSSAMCQFTHVTG